MEFSVGIGIITYNRKDIVRETIDRVRRYTRIPNAALVVADDGSSDGTLAMLVKDQVPVVTGPNMGVVWNKNRALSLLFQFLRCNMVILLEDDTSPNTSGWEAEWIAAAMRWGHANYAGEWMRKYFLSGAGTVEDPILSSMVASQCSAYSRDALTFGGYFDMRFKGYGYSNLEHSARLVRLGYGGTYQSDGKTSKIIYKLIKSDLSIAQCVSYRNDDQIEHNREIAFQVMDEEGYRLPWGDDTHLPQFRSEIANALDGGRERFRLTSAMH